MPAARCSGRRSRCSPPASRAAAKILGERDPDEPFGLSRSVRTPRRPATPTVTWRAAVAPRRARHTGAGLPGSSSAGDGTVNIGVGALSTMKGFKRLNLASLLDQYRAIGRDAWGRVGSTSTASGVAAADELCETPRPRLASLAVGDAASFVNPMNGEGIDYTASRSGMLAAELCLSNPSTAPAVYDRLIGERFDSFLGTGRRFSFIIGHPWLLKPGLRVAVGTQAAADVTLAVMGNLVDSHPRRRRCRAKLADRTRAPPTRCCGGLAAAA
ncbi:MAG: hypothetical protein R2713_11075 [Ilumatobacteraceae bacterium]